jgi:uncharacterized protein (TIGR04255 family)
MPFPAVKRVIYDKNPLAEVIFQARFPRFLPIETEPPAEFQKRLIADYPIYEQRNVLQIIFAPPQEVRPIASEVTGRMHTFQSRDRVWTVTLVGDYFSVSTNLYRRWEDLRQRIEAILKVALEVYSFPIFTRIGLRYQDVISRERLGLANTRWADLLQNYIAGELVTAEIPEETLMSRETVLTMKLDGGDALLLRHGLVSHKETQKIAYLLDSDFFNEEQRTANIDDTLRVADRLHANSGRFFRWCITDKLHNAMVPLDA